MKHLIPALLASALFALSCGSSGNSEAASTADPGAAVFSEKCSMCHEFNTDKIGPALKGVAARWGGDGERLKAFIRNSQSVIQSGDPYATALYQKWHQSVMPPFENLSAEQMEALLKYLQ